MYLHFSSKYELVEYEVGLLKVENDVQLAYRAKIFVQHLHISRH